MVVHGSTVRSFDPISYRFLAGSQMPERLTRVCAIHGFRSRLASAGVIDWKSLASSGGQANPVRSPRRRRLADDGSSLTATHVETADKKAAFRRTPRRQQR